MIASSSSLAVPTVPAPPPAAVVDCPTGCTDACPGEAEGHPFTLCHPHSARITAEWNDLYARLRGDGRAEMLPTGWVREGRLPDYEVGDIDMELVRVPTRIVTETRDLSRAEREVGVGGTLPGCWVLVRRNLRVSVSHIFAHETNLWRLYVKVRDRERSRPVNPFDEPDKSVAEWLTLMVARCYDVTDPAEGAEQMLYALAGQFRTPPAAALTRP